MYKTLNAVFLLLVVLLLSSCASTEGDFKNQLAQQGVNIEEVALLPTEVIVYRESGAPGLTFEYSVIMMTSLGNDRHKFQYLDIDKVHKVNGLTERIYFKVDSQNTIGKEVIVSKHTTLKQSSKERSWYEKASGGGFRNTSYYFDVPIPAKSGSSTKVFVSLMFSDADIDNLTQVLKLEFEALKEFGADI